MEEGWVDKWIREHPWRWRWAKFTFCVEELVISARDWLLDRPAWEFVEGEDEPVAITARSRRRVSEQELVDAGLIASVEDD